jgi:hypothetical protein
MSAEIPEVPDEFAPDADLDALLNAEPPARKRKPPVRTSPTSDQVAAGLTEGEYMVSASGMTPNRVSASPEQPTMEDFRALMAEIATLRQQIVANPAPSAQHPTSFAPGGYTGAPVDGNAVAHPPVNPYTEPVGPKNFDLASRPETPLASSEGDLIHFVEDGFTLGGRVYYRGEQYVAAHDAEWAHLSGTEQVIRYGKRFYRPGPWDGDGYDLSDPNLSPADRTRLLEAMRREQELAKRFAA